MSLIDDIKRDREAGTPGPWGTTSDERSVRGGPKYVSEHICSMDHYRDERLEERAPNARRIARVPDLEAAYIRERDRNDALNEVGQGFLWAVHIIGPDYIHPAEDYASAVMQANTHNDKFLAPMRKTGVAVIAVPTIWPGPPEDHASALAAYREATGVDQ